MAEAILPIEVQILSLWVALTTQMTEEDRHQARLWQLEILDAKQFLAQQQIEFYQVQISKAYNQKVRRQTFLFNRQEAHGHDP